MAAHIPRLDDRCVAYENGTSAGGYPLEYVLMGMAGGPMPSRSEGLGELGEQILAGLGFGEHELDS